MNIGYAIRYLRKKKGWTQQQLAEFSNTTKGNISNLENGNQGYSPTMLRYVADAFGCRESYLFLLAESLDEHGQLNVNIDTYPVDILLSQLPEDVSQTIRTLIAQTLKHIGTQ